MKTDLSKFQGHDESTDVVVKGGASRRDFLKTTGIMTVGFSLAGAGAKAQSVINPTGLVDATQVDSWVAIGADETITIYSGKCEFGQGFSTVQMQLAAEELNVSFKKVKLIFCDTGYTPDQGVTSGSQSHIAEFGPGGLRQALDTARDALLQLASQFLDAPVGQLVVTDGVVSVAGTGPKGQKVTYGQLVQGKRFNLTLNSNTVPKDPSQYRILGTSVPRTDIPAKVVGQFVFTHNVRLPGMLHGRVVRPNPVGSKFGGVNNQSDVEAMPGNPKVVVVKDFVGVVADSQWHAIQAAAALDVNWNGGSTLPVFNNLYSWLRTQPTSNSLSADSGDVDTTMGKAAKTVKATYLHPYQMHGSVGSSCAVADVRGGTGKTATAKIWSSTQGVYPQRDSVANLLGIPNSNVRVIFVEGSGCYGLNGADNVCYDAALLSQAVGAPVRVQYSRHDEMAGYGENYGPAYSIDLQVGVDANGQMIAWNYESWTLSYGNRPSATAPGSIPTGVLAGFPGVVPATGNTPAAPTGATFANNGNAACGYISGTVGNKPFAPGDPSGGTGNITSQKVLNHTILSPFFTGPLRAPARIQNTFANESFIDEVAAAVKADPVAYRLRHLTDQRLIACVTAVAQAANWDTRPSPKANIPKTGVVTGRGVSCVLYEGNNGYCGMYAEVSVDQSSGVVAVTKLIISEDSGPVSNPNGMRNQMEGGALQAVSRTLYEEVKWNDQIGVITTTDWNSYPVYKFGPGYVLPEVQTILINTKNAPQRGAGECAITAVASAVGNAIFDATGVRLRQLPFTPKNVLAALATRS